MMMVVSLHQNTNVTILFIYEDYNSIENAIVREKQLKNWQRKWKIELIRKENPELIDLAKDWY